MTLDLIGTVDPASRSGCRVDCQECDAMIPSDEPAYVYFDLSTSTYMLLCRRCHDEAVKES